MKEGWQRRKVGDLCEVIAGQSPEGKFYNFGGKGMPFYQGKKDFGEKFLKDPQTWTTQITKVAQVGDILMSVRAPVGPVNFATDDICIGRGLAAIRCKRDLDRDFLFFQLLHLQPEITGRDGAVFPSISKSEIEALPISFVPLPEQRRIVCILHRAFAGIANATQNAEKNLRNASDLFEIHLKTVFAIAGDTWTHTTIGDQMTLQRGFDITKRQQRNGRVPVVSSGGIKSFHDEAKAKGPGVVMGRKGTLGKVYYLPNSFWPHDTTLWVKEFNHNNPRFVYYFFRGLDVLHLNTGTANPAPNRNLLHPIRTRWPPLSEQIVMAKTFDALEVETQRLESIYQRKLAALDELKKSLLARAFGGQL